MSTSTDQALIAGVTVISGILLGLNTQHQDSIDKCVSAYYAARKADEFPRAREVAQNATFTACMKAEYARAFSRGAEKVVKIEEFKDTN